MAQNYNYISIGDSEVFENNANSITIDKSRMFEYTPSDIENRLNTFAHKAIKYLISIPTILCSEVKYENDKLYCFAKIVDISYIDAEKRDVKFEFTVKKDYGKVFFENLIEATKVLKSENLQVYRTHWAVRDGAFGELIKAIDEKTGSLELSSLVADGAEQSMPDREKKVIGTISSVRGFLDKLLNQEIGKGAQRFYRGHGNEKYELTPSLMRKDSKGHWINYQEEDRLCKELLIAHYDDFIGDQYCVDRLVRMQHYGLPTRLLDISGNPLVALFFACEKKEEESGEVIIFDILMEKIKYFDSDTVSCLANLSNLNFDQKYKMKLNLSIEEFNDSDVAKKLVHYIKSEKGYFEARINPEDIDSVICMKAKQTNSRIKSQSGAFLIFGHNAKIPETGLENIEIMRISITEKEKILKELDQININATTVYPSIEQTAIHLKRA